MSKEMNFNHKQRLTALGHVVALLAAVMLGYVSFLGCVYLMKGQVVKSAVVASTYAAVLFMLCVLVQKLKAATSHFSQAIMLERIAVVMLLLACMACAVPFTHFFTVNSREKEVASAFKGALAEVPLMFYEYDSLAHQRIERYQSALLAAKKGTKRRKKYGLDRHVEGKTSGADDIVIGNMVSTLERQLLSPAHEQLRREAEEWAAGASGATTWNAFLQGNASEIAKAVESWRQTMADAMAPTLRNEYSRSEADTLAFASTHCDQAVADLDKLAQLCAQRGAPTFPSLLLLAAGWALLFFPYWLQGRHSKSWERFLGKKKSTVGVQQGMETLETVKIDFDQPADPDFHLPATFARQLGKRMEKEMDEHDTDPFRFLLQQFQRGLLDKERLLQAIRDNHSLLDPYTIQTCLDKAVFTREELVGKCGIAQEFVDMLGAVPTDVPPTDEAIKHLGSATTQVFFWGLPSSGKTCALGTILAAAKERTVAEEVRFDEHCQGYAYQEMLGNIFPGDGQLCVLPGRTPVANNFAIEMDLDGYDGLVHPVTLVDMAGELFCTIVWDDNNSRRYITERHQKALKEFERVLIDKDADHQKFHVFIIEYGAEGRRYKEFDPDTYLENGLQYLEDNHVLRDATQGIFVLVTKTDQVKYNLVEGEDEATHLSRYLKKYYGNFLATLNSYCRKYELCGGRLPDPIPFDIGEVCFGSYCRLSTRRAQGMVATILERSKGFRKGWKAVVENAFNQ